MLFGPPTYGLAVALVVGAAKNLPMHARIVEGIMESPQKDFDVLNADFKKEEVQRGELKYYEPLAQRGSVRLKEGLFRTEAEQREFIQYARSIRLCRTRGK